MALHCQVVNWFCGRTGKLHSNNSNHLNDSTVLPFMCVYMHMHRMHIQALLLMVSADPR